MATHRIAGIDVHKKMLAVVVVDAKDDRAREFYLHHDFIPLPSQPNRLFYPVKTIEKLFGKQ